MALLVSHGIGLDGNSGWHLAAGWQKNWNFSLKQRALAP